MWFSTWFKNRIEFLRHDPKYVPLSYLYSPLGYSSISVVLRGSLCSSQDAKSGTTEISPATIKPSSTAGVPNRWAWESIAAYT